MGTEKTARERMSDLAESFPGLVGYEGVRPWRAAVFASSVLADDRGMGALHAARFVLSVFNFRTKWPEPIGTFNLVEALGTWDDANRAAFQAWVMNPWSA